MYLGVSLVRLTDLRRGVVAMQRSRQVAWCGLVAVLMGGGGLVSTASVSAELDYFESVTFKKDGREVNGLRRFRDMARLSITELFLEIPGQGLAAVQFEQRLNPNLALVTRVAINQPEWRIEVADSYPSLKVDSSFEAIEAMIEGTPHVLSVRTSGGEIGSGEFRVKQDQDAGRATELKSLVGEERLVESIPEAGWETLLVLAEIFGPHGGVPESWNFGRGWIVPSLIGPALRNRVGGRELTAWEAVVRPRVFQEESLSAEDREFFGKFQSAGMASE